MQKNINKISILIISILLTIILITSTIFLREKYSEPKNENSIQTNASIYSSVSKAESVASKTSNPQTTETSALSSVSSKTQSTVSKNITSKPTYIITKSYAPSEDKTYKSGDILPVTVVAKNNSNVTAKFNNTTITLTPEHDATSKSADSFVTYSGSFELAKYNIYDIEYVPVNFTVACGGITETFKSGKIICKRNELVKDKNPEVTPQGGKYIDVGSGIITEIVHYEAETFDAYSTNDWSKPTNNYLPKGTVDYGSSTHVYHNGKEQKEYVVLRCGKQVYLKKDDKPYDEIFSVSKTYLGSLPDHNEIEIVSFQTVENQSVLTLNTNWKAPFYFELLPQQYTNSKTQDYTVSQVTSTYVDITFCYATVFKGEIDVSNSPIFSSSNIITNYDKTGNIMDTTLRLNLKKKGGFYGWSASYNNDGQLVFEFLNPANVTVAQNKYGADLSNIKILIDVGHGGKDVGALGFNDNNHTEAIQNLYLAKKLASELKEMGATIYLTRTQDEISSADDKIKKLKRIKPDLCVSIHHNSSTNRNASGFDSYYFTPFSMRASYFVYKNTAITNLYKENNLGWHYYFVARSTVCPVVLTENGYISNSYDYNNIIKGDVNTTKAEAIAKGIAEYFLSISK